MSNLTNEYSISIISETSYTEFAIELTDTEYQLIQKISKLSDERDHNSYLPYLKVTKVEVK